jgi:hypothetical protein
VITVESKAAHATVVISAIGSDVTIRSGRTDATGRAVFAVPVGRPAALSPVTVEARVVGATCRARCAPSGR